MMFLREHAAPSRSVDDSALVRGLMHARAGRRPYVRQPGRLHEKELGALMAGAAFAGFALVSMEDDDGCEALVATRDAETIRFENRQQVGAWLNHLHAVGQMLGTPGVGEGVAYAASTRHGTP